MLNLFAQKFATDRTEGEILAQTPIGVTLGGKEYPLKPLSIRKNREWRMKVADAVNEVAAPFADTALTAESFKRGLTLAFFEFPDKVLGLLYAYSPDLLVRKSQLEDEATDEEVVVAFSRVMAVAYPFFNLLGSMKSAVAATDQATRLQ